MADAIKRTPNGDVLLAKITPCFENGKLGIAKDLTNGIGFGSSEYIAFRPNGSLFNEYLYYFLLQDSFRAEGIKTMSGAVGHKRVSKEFIERLQIPVPPLPEQQRVVAILDEVFAGLVTAIANTERNLRNARELRNSANCGSTKVLLSMPDKGEAGFYTYQRNRHGQFTNQKELPSRLFRIKYEGQEMYLYYRGKLCSSDDE